MKKKLLITATAILMAMSFEANAQAPEKLNYQGVARDNSGAALANQTLGIKISILHNTTVDYSETHNVTTNDFGLYTLIIGDGTPVFGGMASVDWSSGNKFIKVEIDPNGGTNYTDLGTTELLSVPYALYAAESPNTGGPPTGTAGGDLSGNYPNPNIANNAVTTGKIANDAVTAAKIDAMGATNGQVLKFDGTNWAPATDNSGAAGWELTGNTATTTDFIGTTNTEPLRFKVDNEKAGLIPVSGNTFIGYEALQGVTNGNFNSAFGQNALYSTTIGNYNAAFGLRALYSNTTGSSNSAFGSRTLYENTSGSNNSAFGRFALEDNTTGARNAAFGGSALRSNTTASENSAFGYYALYSNTTGISNTAVGSEGLKNNTVGDFNTAMGRSALKANTDGFSNTAIGASALLSNQQGDANVAIGSETLKSTTNDHYNTAVGGSAMLLASGGDYNTAIGFSSLYNASGSQNSVLGSSALYDNTTGDNNTAIGFSALNTNTTGSNNTALGHDADVSTTNLANATVIGAKAYVSQDNSLVLGSINGVNGATADTKVGIGTTSPDVRLHISHKGFASASTGLDGFKIQYNDATAHNWIFHVGISSGDLYLFADDAEVGKFDAISGTYSPSSDARLKEDFKPISTVLSKLMQLEPLSYKFIRQEDNSRYLGFIAQDVEKIFPSIAKEPSPADGDENYTMDYGAFGVVAIKAIQEQQQMIENQKTTIEQQQLAIESLQAQMQSMRAEMTALKD